VLEISTCYLDQHSTQRSPSSRDGSNEPRKWTAYLVQISSALSARSRLSTEFCIHRLNLNQDRLNISSRLQSWNLRPQQNRPSAPFVTTVAILSLTRILLLFSPILSSCPCIPQTKVTKPQPTHLVTHGPACLGSETTKTKNQLSPRSLASSLYSR
jgi:hypothetical protein